MAKIRLKGRSGQSIETAFAEFIRLQEYLRQRGGEDTDILFPSESNSKLVGTSIAHDLARYNRNRGVEKISAHLFRHTFAKNWILQGGDPLRLQKVLGHATLTMSQHYANLYRTDLKKGFEEFNLLSRLKTNDKIKLRGLKSVQDFKNITEDLN